MLIKDAKNWSCPKKLEARRQTIIEPYREIFGKNIPRGKQYWAMSGQCATSSGLPLENCELDQVVNSGLINISQFHGVEINHEIHKLNDQGWPEANWHCGDFLRVMQGSCADEEFNPAIVNADFITMPDRTIGYLSDILSFLSFVTKEVMLVANMVMEYQRFPERNRDIEFVMNRLNNKGQFQKSLKNREWKVYNQKYYSYTGTGQESRTTMGSLIFYFNER